MDEVSRPQAEAAAAVAHSTAESVRAAEIVPAAYESSDVLQSVDAPDRGFRSGNTVSVVPTVEVVGRAQSSAG